MKLSAVIENGYLRYREELTLEELAKELTIIANLSIDEIVSNSFKAKEYTNEQKSEALVNLVKTYSSIGNLHSQILLAEAFKIQSEEAYNIIISKLNK